MTTNTKHTPGQKLDRLELEHWKIITRLLAEVRAVTEGDLKSKLSDNSTPGTRLLQQLREWGNLRAQQGAERTAAPELLEALRHCKAHMESISRSALVGLLGADASCFINAVIGAQQAITKAEGQP